MVYRVPTIENDDLALGFEGDLSSLGVNSFDYIRMAHLNGAVADERALLYKVFKSVFAGHLESVVSRKLTKCISVWQYLALVISR